MSKIWLDICVKFIYTINIQYGVIRWFSGLRKKYRDWGDNEVMTYEFKSPTNITNYQQLSIKKLYTVIKLLNFLA